ncbi:MAG: cupin domain-containing protein [Verrucomicrobiales bacterium]|nr:cupin domain-containing protein [Verrucomicrobiales bacterium]
MDAPTLPVFVATPGSGKRFQALGDEVKVLISGEQTGGTFSLVEVVTPPGGGPPPHWHSREDECFHILEGRIELWQDGVWSEAPNPHRPRAFGGKGAEGMKKGIPSSSSNS